MLKSGNRFLIDTPMVFNERKCQYQILRILGPKVYVFGVNYSGIIIRVLGWLVGLEIRPLGKCQELGPEPLKTLLKGYYSGHSGPLLITLFLLGFVSFVWLQYIHSFPPIYTPSTIQDITISLYSILYILLNPFVSLM